MSHSKKIAGIVGPTIVAMVRLQMKHQSEWALGSPNYRATTAKP
jgi:hypothetical protein